MSSSTFWSRRQAAVAEEARVDDAARLADAAAAAEAQLDERDDAEILQELDLPEPEALESPEAVRSFLQSAVPQRLKTRALRRLWRLNPVLANLDGLVDYGEDFTDSATVVENMQTAYQVGKGMFAHIEAMAAKDAAAQADTQPEPEAPELTALSEDDLTDATEGDEALAQPAPAAHSMQEADDDQMAQEAPVLPPSRRRMTFQFETTA